MAAHRATVFPLRQGVLQTAALAFASSVSLPACDPPELPGELVGVYAIEGALRENTCGTQALPAPDPLVFEAELRDQDGVGIWIVGQPPGVSGRLSADGEFTFRFTSERTAIEPGPTTTEPLEVADFLAVDPRPDTQPGCRLRFEESITGRATAWSRERPDAGQALDAGAPPSSVDLEATNRIAVVPIAGSDCRPALAIQGGAFHELPCEASYQLTGSRQD